MEEVQPPVMVGVLRETWVVGGVGVIMVRAGGVVGGGVATKAPKSVASMAPVRLGSNSEKIWKRIVSSESSMSRIRERRIRGYGWLGVIEVEAVVGGKNSGPTKRFAPHWRTV